MKKLFVLMSALLIGGAAMTGCDPSGTFYCKIKNSTDSDLFVQVEGEIERAISVGEDAVVLTFSELGVWGENSFAPTATLSNRQVTINGALMSDEIWRRKNWEYTGGKKYHTAYTLNVDDNFLESFTVKNQNL